MKDLFDIIKESLVIKEDLDIQEAIKVKKNSQIDKAKHDEANADIMDPEDLPYPEVKALDYNGEEVVILGKPFQKKGDANYKFSIDYIKRKGYTIYYSFKELLNDLPFAPADDDWFVYAKFEYKGTIEVDCYAYGPEGVYVPI